MTGRSDPSNAMLISESAFGEIADAVCIANKTIDRTMLSMRSEASDFVRLNRNQVRQTTQVNQFEATLSVVGAGRRLTTVTTLGPDIQHNIAVLRQRAQTLAQDLPQVPADPHLLLPESIVSSSHHDSSGQLPVAERAIADIVTAANGCDLVGFYASGPAAVAFADSRGQRNWHQVNSFHFDWCISAGPEYSSDQAVKSAYAGRRWLPGELQDRMQRAREQLEPLTRTRRQLSPGNYRAYIAPAAVAELLDGLAHTGFSRKERETGSSSLSLMANAGETMNNMVQITEAVAGGIAPGFTSAGYVRPDSIPLIRNGQLQQCLVSPRSAAEFDDNANSDSSEHPNSLVLSHGSMDPSDALAALDTGIWISNLWYLNYSDRPNCRMTGMTRFASFWVENGQLIAPINPMRFDESLIRLFGDKLIDLSSESEFMPNPSTWGARALSSCTAPGMLVADMAFTI